MDFNPIDPFKCFYTYQISCVDVFGFQLLFLLGAFLLIELLKKEHLQFGKINIKSIYIPRMPRIWLLYYFCFLWMLLLSHSTEIFERPITVLAQFNFSLFIGNWYFKFSEWFHYQINSICSIYLITQLYIFLPLIVFLEGAIGLKVFSFFAFFSAYTNISYYLSSHATGFSGEAINSFVFVHLNGRLTPWTCIIKSIIAFISLICWLIASIFLGIHAYLPHLSLRAQTIIGWFLVLPGALFFSLVFYGLACKCPTKVFACFGRIFYGVYVSQKYDTLVSILDTLKKLIQFSRHIGFYDKQIILDL